MHTDKQKHCMIRFALTLHLHSYDYDTDPVKRNQAPDFYGYIPGEGIARPLLLVCMTLNSALLLLVRAFIAAMLTLVSKRYLAIYLAGDMAPVSAPEGGEEGLPLLAPSQRRVGSVCELSDESGGEDDCRFHGRDSVSRRW